MIYPRGLWLALNDDESVARMMGQFVLLAPNTQADALHPQHGEGHGAR